MEAFDPILLVVAKLSNQNIGYSNQVDVLRVIIFEVFRVRFVIRL